MQLDSFTLLVATSATIVFLGCALLYFWNRDRRSVWLLWWAVPFLVGGISVLTYLRPNWQADLFSIAVGNAVRIGAIGLLWQGARAFERRPPMALATFAVAGLWLALCTIPAFLASMPARIVGVSLAHGAFCCLAAWELWRGRAEHLPSRLPAVAVFLSFALLMAVRTVGVNILPFPMGSLPLDPLWMAGFDFAVFIHAMFLGLLLIALTKERLELEQRNIALVDPLTGLMNRRAFMAHVERNADRVGNGRDAATTLLALDLDHFKSINDRFGHDVGDRVLAAFAVIASDTVRPTDFLFRMGGEEFCFILPDTDVKAAIAVAERIRHAFATSAVTTHRGERVGTTVSIGIANVDVAGVDFDIMLAAADAALYEAKSRGRNRVVVADPAALRRPGEHSEIINLLRWRA